MTQVHFIFSRTGDIRHVACYVSTGAVVDIRGLTKDVPEKDPGDHIVSGAEDWYVSDYSVDYSKIIYIGNKNGPLSNKVITAEMAKMNLSPDEIQNVQFAYARRYPNRGLSILPLTKTTKSQGLDPSPT